MDKTKIKIIQTTILAELQKLEPQLGVSFKFGSGTYTNDYATLKLTITDLNTDGSKVDIRAVNLDNYAEALGLDKNVRGKTMNFVGKDYTIVGFDKAARKNCIIIERLGKQYTTTIDIVKQMLRP